MHHTAVTPRVWHIEEDYRDYCTLVRGEKLAILWDTGQGKGDLSAFLEAHVTTPLLVLLSHGHADHIGGLRPFGRAFLNREDRWMAEAHSRLVGDDGCRLEDLPPGTVWDLGGLTARVVSLAGHTRGSVGLLLEEERLLLAGDALNPTLLLLGREAAPIPTLRRTLEEAEGLPFDRFLASHYPTPQSKRIVGAHLRHLDCLRTEAPSRPGPYGPRICRSTWKERGLRSVIHVDRALLGGP